MLAPKGAGLGNPITTGLNIESRIGSKNTPLWAQVQSRLNMMPPVFANGLSTGAMQIRKQHPYAVKGLATGDQLVKMFMSTDVKEDGKTNVQAGKLDSNTLLYLQGIRLLYRKAGTKTFTTSLPDELKNGEFTLKMGDFTLLENAPVSQFRADETEQEQGGYFDLGAPRFVESQIAIDFDIQLAENALSASAGDIKIELVGAIIS